MFTDEIPFPFWTWCLVSGRYTHETQYGRVKTTLSTTRCIFQTHIYGGLFRSLDKNISYQVSRKHGTLLFWTRAVL